MGVGWESRGCSILDGKTVGGGGSKNKCSPVKINVVWSWGSGVVICAD